MLSSGSRHSRARTRAADSTRWRQSSEFSRDSSLSLSRVRAKSEFHRDSPAASPLLRSREFGTPDYRSTSVDIRTTSPCRSSSGGYLPRTTKRTISITTIHNNENVPLYTKGHIANTVTTLEDVTSAYPALDRDTLRRPLGCKGMGASSPYNPYLTSFYSSYNSDNTNFRPSRFREPSPLRYSSNQRFSSRFL